MNKIKPNPSGAVPCPTNLPPLYHLHSIGLCTRRGFDILAEPKFPVQICPAVSNSIQFRLWGSANYDPHGLFDGDQLNGYDPLMMPILSIEYSILYCGEDTRFRHDFNNTFTHLTLNGMTSRLIVMRNFKSLADMPELPYDWEYFQFVN